MRVFKSVTIARTTLHGKCFNINNCLCYWNPFRVLWIPTNIAATSMTWENYGYLFIHFTRTGFFLNM